MFAYDAVGCEIQTIFATPDVILAVVSILEIVG